MRQCTSTDTFLKDYPFNALPFSDLSKKSDIKKARKKEEERLVKWNKMARRSSIELLQHRKFRSRVEKGIPKQVRGVIWYKLCNIDATRKHLSGVAKSWLEEGVTLYTHYVQEARRNPTRFTTLGVCTHTHTHTHSSIRSRKLTIVCCLFIANRHRFTKDRGEISRDIHRTFPNSVVFNVNEGEGQTRLERVLFAYSVANPGVGYTQGMNYIVALLLGFMPEEEVPHCRCSSGDALYVSGECNVAWALYRSSCCNGCRHSGCFGR